MAEDTEALLYAKHELAQDDDECPRRESEEGYKRLSRRPTLLFCLFIASFSLNIVLATRYALTPRGFHRNTVVDFSDAVVHSRFPPQTEYASLANVTHTDFLWESLETYVNTGFVALSREELKLPPSDVFPWDTSKEVYVLSAFHLLHCLYILYDTLRGSQTVMLTDSDLEHAMHCLDALRGEVTCAADDTPYVLNGELITENEDGGIIQTRKCRDWQELEEFAVQNSACYKNFADSDPGHDTLEEWKYCPETSPYKAIVAEYFA